MPIQAPNTSNQPTVATSSSNNTAVSVSQPAANPEPLTGDTWSYANNTKPLFGTTGNPTVQDVVQGGIGDCFLNADFVQLARENPDFIKQHITAVSNPSDPAHPNYAVQLFDKDGKPQTVIVDSKKLTNKVGITEGSGGDSSSFLDQGGSNALWPTIYEKAYAIVNGESIDDLNKGGNSADAWRTLTGQAGDAQSGMPSVSTFVHDVSDTASGVNVGTISGAEELPGWNGSSTTLEDGRYQVTQDRQNPDILHIVDTQSPNLEAWDIPCNHALAVEGLSSDEADHDPAAATDPKLRVNVANPWGASLTNQQNLQDVPYSVLKAVTGNTYLLPKPSGSSATGAAT